MANCIDFPRGPVAPNFGFGFGMASSPAIKGGWQQPATIGHSNPAAFQHLASTMQHASPIRTQKRRYEPEDDADAAQGQAARGHAATTGHDAMDRSPTPERPKRGPPKRARVVNVAETGDKEKNKENKPAGSGDEVDVGVLLASLPLQSLLPLLTSLLNAQPSLKSTILPLIPRPTLDTAIQMLAQSAKKLRDAYPYSNTQSFATTPVASPSSATGFGFGSATSATGFGFGSARPSPSMFGNPTVSMFAPLQPQANTSGMRDSYILSRLGPHITEFVSTCMSYLPYFSYIPSASLPTPSSSSASPSTSNPHTQLPLPKDKLPPTEIYQLLAALMVHILAQPPLAQSVLIPQLLPRLQQEWLAWVGRVDAVVNTEGGMFRDETVRGWERGLDEFAEANKGVDGWVGMKEVRDRWVTQVGWLVGRRAVVGGMDMEEEL